ncbi:ribosomal protein L33 [Candidatus Carsonella ruddii CS isolate Thao2000]|uniref:Large ribosomal subunit protein bL33 n=1 Tax=Candidatus Carsonella ruddii CS isolate Thao2000 TaxID=1202537 RepID=J7GTD2_CARRU|nr:50S ribosomal protein L33 [Candidatus Carsonella ruddii]AFP83789.1 ribosomal protein L33 [Candidatus Carsonella ruddii CS isolate Thao2000]
MFILIKLKSSKSSFFYIKKKNKKNVKKINIKKFDPFLNKRVIFNEIKI